MAKKKTHGGARKNAWRKPIEDKKQQVKCLCSWKNNFKNM